jgi:hypothetical protein
MARVTKASDEAIISDDIYKVLEKYKGKRVQVAAFGTFFNGKVHKINQRKGQVEIKEEEDIVTLEIERITGIHLVVSR